MPVPIYSLIAALCGKLKKTRQDWSVTVSNQFIHRRETYGYRIKTNLYRSLDVRWIWLSGLPLACCVHEHMRPASWSWLPVRRRWLVASASCPPSAIGADSRGPARNCTEAGKTAIASLRASTARERRGKNIDWNYGSWFHLNLICLLYTHTWGGAPWNWG